jgi:hypothetical protein
MHYKYSDEKLIPDILDIIHDRWFDADKISFLSKERTLSIPFKEETRHLAVKKEKWLFILNRKVIPIVQWFFNIHGVIEYSINDTEKIGEYDFNEIHYDVKNQLLRITTNIPIDIAVKVDGFKITLEETDKIVGYKKQILPAKTSHGTTTGTPVNK